MKALLLIAIALLLAGCSHVNDKLDMAEGLCRDHRGVKGLFGWAEPHTEIVCEDGDIIVIDAY